VYVSQEINVIVSKLVLNVVYEIIEC
jgi:hypothetical protein